MWAILWSCACILHLGLAQYNGNETDSLYFNSTALDGISTKPKIDRIASNHGMGNCGMDGYGLNDGLMCWTPYKEAWVDDIENPTTVYIYCPVIVDQMVTENIAKAYIGSDGRAEQFDYSECGFDIDDLSADEKKTLVSLRLELHRHKALCKSTASQIQTLTQPFRLRFNPNLLYYTYSHQFDNIACIVSLDGIDVPKQLGCPESSGDYFEKSMQVDRTTDLTKTKNADNVYSLGWSCLKDPVKELLKKTGIDRYFKPGCAAYKDDLVELPYTAIGDSVEINCKSLPETRDYLVNQSRKMSFTCNKYSEWEGSRYSLDRPECRADGLVALLNVMALRGCPFDNDGVATWRTERGEVQKIRCPRHIMGFDTNDDTSKLWDPEPGHEEKERMLKYRAADATRECTKDGKWLPADYKDCVNALPTVMRNGVGIVQTLANAKAIRNLKLDNKLLGHGYYGYY